MAKILVVEDRAADRELLVTLLTHHGYEVVSSDNGRDALRLAHEQPPDLMVVDMLVPEMDGLEFTRAVRAAPDIADIPIVIYTATYETWELEKLARAAGVSRVLEKPADPQEILQVVEESLRPSPQGGPGRAARAQT